MGNIGAQDTGSLGTEEDAGIGGKVDIGEVGLVGGVQLGVQVAGLEEVGV